MGAAHKEDKMNIYAELLCLKNKIPRNTYKTILGQLKAGDVKGASVGIERLKKNGKVKN